jgi:hypothetical protein
MLGAFKAEIEALVRRELKENPGSRSGGTRNNSIRELNSLLTFTNQLSFFFFSSSSSSSSSYSCCSTLGA